ncbi:hypothetical protein ES703_101067 [subsurface metagenome]
MASSIASSLFFFSSSVFFFSRIALITLLNASASFSIRSINSSFKTCACSARFFILLLAFLYSFFPYVRLATIDDKAEPSAPESAATLPPPGVGESVDNSFENSRRFMLKSSCFSAIAYSIIFSSGLNG